MTHEFAWSENGSSSQCISYDDPTTEKTHGKAWYLVLWEWSVVHALTCARDRGVLRDCGVPRKFNVDCVQGGKVNNQRSATWVWSPTY